MIEKTAKNKTNHYRLLTYHKSARDAFRQVLNMLVKQGNYKLLLPAYIGYSAKEGSGIYDPVVASGIKYAFYKVNRNLQIIGSDLEKAFDSESNNAVLLVHYYGVPDANYNAVLDICRKKGAYIIEDAAHALFTDFVDCHCGFGDCTFYSIHKMLPFSDGGMLKCMHVFSDIQSTVEDIGVFNYDLRAIAADRKRNAEIWNQCIIESDLFPDFIEPLYKFRTDVTYQTFPVIIKGSQRDRLYFSLNAQRYGAVSLYHEMIQPIKNMFFEDSLWLSDHILNLPVHQDIEAGEIVNMFKLLRDVIRRNGD